jgi:hypothetical protein
VSARQRVGAKKAAVVAKKAVAKKVVAKKVVAKKAAVVARPSPSGSVAAARASLRAHYAKAHEATSRAVEKAIRASWKALAKETKGERLYAFAVYTSGEGSFGYATISACTEEGLDEVGAAYLPRHAGSTLERERASLRWNACDWPLHDHTSVPLPGLSSTVAIRTRREDDAIWEAFAAALARCDADGLFGRGEARAALTLAILCGDMSTRFFGKGVRRLNPPRVAARAQREWRAGIEASRRTS